MVRAPRAGVRARGHHLPDDAVSTAQDFNHSPKTDARKSLVFLLNLKCGGGFGDARRRFTKPVGSPKRRSIASTSSSGSVAF